MNKIKYVDEEKCPVCGSENFTQTGYDQSEEDERYYFKCHDCGTRFIQVCYYKFGAVIIGDNKTEEEFKSVNEWISVNDRLPKKDERYLVVHADDVFISSFSTLNNSWLIGEVAYWMPLPEMPRKEKD